MTIEQEESGNVFSAIVIDHATNPRNAGSIDGADAYALVLEYMNLQKEPWRRAYRRQ
jgi:NifU-like protein involved in Fe-S cluster formation